MNGSPILRSHGRAGSEGGTRHPPTVWVPGMPRPNGQTPAGESLRESSHRMAANLGIGFAGGETTGCSDVSIQFVAFSIIPPSSFPTLGNEARCKGREPARSGDLTVLRPTMDRVIAQRTPR